MAKISLCLIVGNVEEYIERCLTSFKPIADEICVVRAIGNQTPDKTLDIAREKFGAITGEYKNKPGHEDWPHVDDFAAARNASFDLATGDYIFWCDTDDVLEDGSAEIIRQLADRGGYACFVMPYRIFGRGVNVPRERMVARGSGKWLYPVHECYQFHIQPVKAVEDQRAVVCHLPHILTKTGSNARNLRILKSIPESEMNAGLWFHLAGELGGINDMEGSIEATKKALASPDLGKPERYDLLMNLAFKTQDPAQIETLLHEAHKTDPRRREALYLLANNSLNFGNYENALSYARQMNSLPPPQVQDWNHRAPIYGWAGDDMFQQCLRVNGRLLEAERMRVDNFQRVGGAKIALVHATRGRPRKASEARKMWLDMADAPETIEHIFVYDEDDAESAVLSRMHSLKIPAGGGCVAAWNAGAAATQAPVIVQMSDDWVPPAKWDKLILERIGDLNTPSVLAVSDGARTDDLLCMAICTRAYYWQDQFLFHPWFTGVYSDNWFTEVAKKRGQIINARDLVFTHLHPAFGKAEPDKTYAEQNAPERYAHGQNVIETLRQGKDWSTVPGYFNYIHWYQHIAKWLNDGDTVAEIGVWFGRSVIYLAQELQRLGKHNVKIIAVDGFTGELNQPAHEATVAANGGHMRKAFEENLERCGVRHMVQIVQGNSWESAELVNDGKLRFCFIDAAHDYESVKRDVTAWLPKVAAGGVISGHDAQSADVMRAVSDVIPNASKLGFVWAKM